MNSVDVFVGKQITARRGELALTREQLAERAGIPRHVIAELETGGLRAPSQVLVSVAEALNVDVLFFFRGLPTPEPARTQISSSGTIIPFVKK